MRTYFRILFLLFLLNIPFSSSDKLVQAAVSIKMKGIRTGKVNDTDEVMNFIKNGNKLLKSKHETLDRVKACIDIATAICERRKLDIPAALYLLEA